MFDSGISVKNLIEELKTEVDIALEIPDATYISWLNSLQQILYTEIIKEQRRTAIHPSRFDDNSINFDKREDWLLNDNESIPRFEDIIAVYAGDIQLIKSTFASGEIFPNTYYKTNFGGKPSLSVNVDSQPRTYTIFYIVKPALVDEKSNANVMVPIEFIDLVKAKLRGEAYKLANEGERAAMWLNDYNILLETFKVWIAEKTPNFGL